MKHNWYEEQRERQEAARRARRKRDEVVNLLVNVAIIVAALIALFVVMANAFHRPVRERAAYLEGRWGVDHATAMAYAESEVR